LNIADRFIIKEYGTYSDVGVYSAIKDLITKIATFTTMPIVLAYHPKIMQTWNMQNKKEAIRLIREAMKFLIMVFVVVFFCFMISKDFLYHRILHLNVSGLWVVSISLTLNSFLWQAALLAHKPLELLLKQNMMLWAIAICLILNVIGNIIFIPRFGYISAAIIAFISSLLYMVIALVLSYYMVKKLSVNE